MEGSVKESTGRAKRKEREWRDGERGKVVGGGAKSERQ